MSKLKKGLKKHKKKAGDDVMISNKDGKMDFADEKSKKAAEDLCVTPDFELVKCKDKKKKKKK